MIYTSKHSAQETGVEKAKNWDPPDSLNKFQASVDYTVSHASRNKSTKQRKQHTFHSFFWYIFAWIYMNEIYIWKRPGQSNKVRF